MSALGTWIQNSWQIQEVLRARILTLEAEVSELKEHNQLLRDNLLSAAPRRALSSRGRFDPNDKRMAGHDS